MSASGVGHDPDTPNTDIGYLGFGAERVNSPSIGTADI